MQIEQKHTPGPWNITRSKMATDGAFDYAISADSALVIAEAFGRDAKGGWPSAEANARLIAAAPDGLALAKLVVEVVDPACMIERDHPHTTLAEVYRAAEALIAKAQGASDAL